MIGNTTTGSYRFPLFWSYEISFQNVRETSKTEKWKPLAHTCISRCFRCIQLKNKNQNKSRHADVCMWWCIGRVDLTSTSYVYSRLVGNSPGWVVADAAIHPSIRNLGLAYVEVADHMTLSVGVVGDAVSAVPYYWFIIQSPCYPRFWGSLHRAWQRNKLIDVVDLLTKWSQNLGGAI